MSQIGTIKSVLGAVLCGTGVTAGIALSSIYGSVAWIVGIALVIVGFAVAAAPISKRRAR